MPIPVYNTDILIIADKLSQLKLPVDPTSNELQGQLENEEEEKRNNDKGWWHFGCFCMSEVLPASLTMKLHCLHTTTSTSVHPAVFR